MTQLISNQSAIEYLFPNINIDMEKSFYNLPYKDPAKKREFIERSLSTLMKVNQHLLNKNEAFYLVDPRAYNDQCHLYALKAAQLKKEYKNLTLEQQMEKNEDNRFLHLSLFLSFCFQEKKLFKICVNKTLKEMNAFTPQKSRFNAFLMDSDLDKFACASINQIFKNYVEKSIKQQDPLESASAELAKLAAEDLFVDANRGKKYGSLYTFPKLAGTILMVDILAKENIPFVLKIKAISKDGYGGTIIHQSRPIDPAEKAVIILEGFATEDGTSLDDCKTKATSCPHYFYQNVDSKNMLHSVGESCFFCQPVDMDVQSIKEKINLAAQDPQDMFCALGTDFVMHHQPAFQKYFTNNKNYPHLGKLFSLGAEKVGTLGLGIDNPKAFSICHAYADNVEQALSESMRLEMSPAEFLNARGVI